MEFISIAVYFEYKRVNCSVLYQGYPFNNKKNMKKYLQMTFTLMMQSISMEIKII